MKSANRIASANRIWLPLRFALREARSGLRGFYVFIAGIALGVFSIAGILSLAAALTEGLSREGRAILGGDLAFTLVQRPATPRELAFLQAHGLVSQVATLRAMARAGDGEAALVELKAVDKSYPLYGEVALDPPLPLREALTERDGAFGAVADPTLLARLNLKPGARLAIGAATIELRAALVNEPDKLASGIAFGPRLLMDEAGLRATGLLQPGALVRWHYRLRLPSSADRDAVGAVADAARAQLPEAGWEIRSRNEVSPRLEQDIARFIEFLTVAGLTALLMGGVGVGNAVKSHLDRRRENVAILKSLGADGRTVVAIYLTQVMLMALIGSLVGVAAGALLPYAVKSLAVALAPFPLTPGLHPSVLALALLYGLLTGLAFSLWPLSRACDVPAAALFRDLVAPHRARPRGIHVALALGAGGLLAAMTIISSYDRRVALVYVAIAAAVFAALHLVAVLIVAAAARMPRFGPVALRLAVAGIHRPGAPTSSIVLSLGLGIALLVSVNEIDGNLRRQFAAELPAKAPSFYFLDIPVDQADRFNAFLRRQAPHARLDEVPMLRGRIVAARGMRAEDLNPDPDVAWVLQSDRGLTYARELPKGSRLTAGEWWNPDYDGPPLVSFEQRIAEGLGLKLGDTVTVNVLGRDITARIASLRRVDWQSLSINFVMVFSPNSFVDAPHTRLATVTFPDGGTPQEEGRLIRAVAAAFPMVAAVRVKEVLEAFGALVANLGRAIGGASVVTLVAASLVMGGALAAGQRHRVYDAVILRTLGATRGGIVGLYALEYAMLGGLAALFGTASGSLAGWVIVTKLMHLPYVWLPRPAAAAAAAAVALTLAMGLVGTFAALRHKPASVLRNL
ncbi:MAG: FtsX-like permease family protein [Pseudolabrys sp.]|nr:FtsX-like permease family protein [Pseudolabrys sp.]